MLSISTHEQQFISILFEIQTYMFYETHLKLFSAKFRPFFIGVHASLQWRHNERDDVSNHRRLDCLLNRLLRRIQKTSKLRVTGLCGRNLPVTGEFPSQRASDAETVSVSPVGHT